MRLDNRYTETNNAIVTPAEHGGLMIGNLCHEDPNLTVHCIMVEGSWKVRAASKKGVHADELEGMARKAIAAWVSSTSRIASIHEARGVVAYQIAVIPRVVLRHKPPIKGWHCVMVEITGPGVGNFLPFCCEAIMSITADAETVQVHKHTDDLIAISAFIAQTIASDCIPRVYSVLTPSTIARRMLAA